MTQKSTIQVALVNEMKKGRGIGPVIDKFKTCMIEVSFDGSDKLELMSNNKDLLQIAVEMIERIYGDKAKSSGSDEIQADLDESKVVWKFPKDASHVVNELYKKEMENVPKVETTMLHDSKQLIITCHRNSVSEVRPRVIDLFKLYKDSKWKDMDVRKKTKSAKTFCQVTNAEDCLCTYDESSRKINLVGKDKNSITSMEKEWVTFYEKSSSKSKPSPATEGQVNKKDENTNLSVEDNMQKDNSKQNEATGEVKSEETSVRAVVNSPRAHTEEPCDTSSSRFGESFSGAKRNVRGDGKANESMYEKHDHHQGRSNGPTDRIPDTTGASDIVGPESRERNKYVFQVGPIKVLIYKQSVVDIQKMDAIVNAANDHMEHAGGVAAFISKAAGKSMDDECDRYIKKHGPLNVSKVFVSTPGKMSCKGIFHAVGPRWSEYIDQQDKCAKDLYRTIYKCLICMDEKGWRNIALCAISSGIFGVPKKLCTVMYLKAIEDFAIRHPRREMEVHFIDVNQEILDLMINTHEERLKNGFSPDFKIALRYPSAKKVGWGGKGRHTGITPDRDWDDRTSLQRHDPGGTAQKREYRSSSHVDWEEYIPERVQDAEVDIEKFCKGQNKNNKKEGKENKSKAENAVDISEGKCVYCSKKAAKKLTCGHLFCALCLNNSKDECQKCEALRKGKKPAEKRQEVVEPDMPECPICLEKHETLATLKCSHNFCKDCLKKIAREKPVCPVCGVPFGIVKGTQPDGRMFVRKTYEALEGYESNGTIEILYEFENGVQKKCHPNPGKPYRRISRQAYLPDTDEGQRVLRLLKTAFSRRLIFTIGDSRTTGQTDQITWNDIHHKTSPHGGPFGYPDKTYLKRVLEELAAKGISEWQ